MALHPLILDRIRLIFLEGGKLESLAKNPQSKDDNQQQTQPTYDLGIEPTHIARGAFIPLGNPCSPKQVNMADGCGINFLLIVWFRKYAYPHHGGNWKFRRGGGLKTQEIPEGRGVV